MRPLRRSRTSDWVATLRALYHHAPEPLRVEDPHTARLLPAHWRWAVRVLGAHPRLTEASHHALGLASLGLTHSVPLRTAAIDEVVRKGVAEGIEQLVILGAGLDARAWRLEDLRASTVYELDHPDTQRFKTDGIRDLVAKAERVVFCPIDFEERSLEEALLKTTFDPGRPSTWLWEGVTMYLERPTIESTLLSIRNLTARSSRLCFTYVPPDFGLRVTRALGDLGGRWIGEPLLGLVSRDDVQRLLEEASFTVERDDTAMDWAERYWPPRARRWTRSYERLVVATRD